jgi:UDP-glucose 4-epimerase
MRVFLTGATGFLGSWVLRKLLEGEIPVAALTRRGSSLERLRGCGEFHRVEGELESVGSLRPALEAFGVDTVIHCAWAGVGNAHRNDDSQIAANVGPTAELALLARDLRCKAWIGLGSQAEYGPAQGPLDERAPTEPTTLYGAAKLASCVLARRICELGGVRFAWMRVFSTYGPGEDSGWLIPYLTKALLRGETPALTACGQRWDFLFGPDAAEAVVAVAASPEGGGIYNLGSGVAHPLKTVVEQIRDLVNPALALGIGQVPYRPDQVMHLEADIRRLAAGVGWRPRTTLEEGLRQTVEWHRQQWARET